jgi:hypothetical protein
MHYESDMQEGPILLGFRAAEFHTICAVLVRRPGFRPARLMMLRELIVERLHWPARRRRLLEAHVRHQHVVALGLLPGANLGLTGVLLGCATALGRRNPGIAAFHAAERCAPRSVIPADWRSISPMLPAALTGSF